MKRTVKNARKAAGSAKRVAGAIKRLLSTPDVGPPPPLPSHNFIVELDSECIPFSKIQSIEIGVETEPLIEGGENRFVYSLSKQNSTEKVLVMERIVVSDEVAHKPLMVGTVFKNMIITVLDQNRCRKKTYVAGFVILKKRSLSGGLNAMAGEVLIENMEFIYRELTEIPG